MKTIKTIFAILLVATMSGCGGGGGGGDSGKVADNNNKTYVFSAVLNNSISGVTPRFMTLDGTNLYVAVDNKVVRINTLTSAQTEMSGFSNGPVGLATHSGKLYVTQTGGLYRTSLSNFPAGSIDLVTSACLNCSGLVFSGDIAYISNALTSNAITTFDTVNNVSGTKALSDHAMGLALLQNVLIAPNYTSTVNFIDTSLPSWTSPTRSLTVSGDPIGVVSVSNGDVYISSYLTNKVTRIHNGVVESTPLIDATYVCHPTGLAVDEVNKFLYVTSERGQAGTCGLQNHLVSSYILKVAIDI